MKGILYMKKQTLKENDLIPAVVARLAENNSGFSKWYFTIDDYMLIVKEKPTSQKPLHRLIFSKLDNFGLNSAAEMMYFVGLY
jgi:hypothetical protein